MSAPRVQLREPQIEARRAVYDLWRRDPSGAGLVVLPTGVGKTIFALSIVADALTKWRAEGRQLRVAWLAHRKELLTQPLNAWRALWPDLADAAGIVQGGERSGEACPLVIGSVHTLRNPERAADVRRAGGEAFGLVVVDEAHRSVSVTHRRAVEGLTAASPARPKVLGLTATPERADGKQLGALYELAYSYSIVQAIDEGFLVPFKHRVCRVPSDDLDALEEMDDPEARDEVLLGLVVEHSVDAIREHGRGRKGVVFCASVAQAEATSERLREAGVRALTVHGSLPDAERDERLEAHRRGDVDWLTNCDVLTEGYDDPSIDCVFVARPMRSKPLYVQAVGRGLRLAPGKTHCLIIDIAGASQEHDLIHAPTLLQGDLDDDREREEREPGEGRSRSLYRGLFDPRARSRHQWLQVPGLPRGAFVCGMGAHGIAALVEEVPGRWQVYHLPKQAPPAADGTWPERQPPRALCGSPLEVGLAMAIGEDLIRRSEAGSVSRKGLAWRDLPPTQGQAEQLRRKRLPVPKTRGEASDAITIRKSLRDLKQILRRSRA